MAGATRDVVIIDLGAVMIEWDPGHPRRAMFIDDIPANAAATTALGIHGFTSPEALRTGFVGFGQLA